MLLEDAGSVTAFKVVKELFVLALRTVRNSVQVPRGTYVWEKWNEVSEWVNKWARKQNKELESE